MHHLGNRFTLPRAVRVGLAGIAGLAGMSLVSLAPAPAHAVVGAPASQATVVRGRHIAREHYVSPARRRLLRRERQITDALRVAVRHEGAPYVYGATGPGSFDCSGLTSFAYHRAGFPGVPRTAAEQADFAHRISRQAMRPGDLVFFYSGDHVYHVGLFAGRVHGRPFMVDAPHTGARVRREAIWGSAWFPGTLR